MFITVIPFLSLTKLSVASLLASQGGLDVFNRGHLAPRCNPAHPHFQWNLQNSTVWILPLFLMSVPLYLFLLLCSKLHLLLTVAPLTIS